MRPGGVGPGRDDRGRGPDHAQVGHATGARDLGLDVRVGVDDLVGRPRAQIGRVGRVVVAGRVVPIDQVLELGDRQLDHLTRCHGDGPVKQPGPGHWCRTVGVGRVRHVVVDVLGGIDDRELPVSGTVGVLNRSGRVLERDQLRDRQVEDLGRAVCTDGFRDQVLGPLQDAQHHRATDATEDRLDVVGGVHKRVLRPHRELGTGHIVRIPIKQVTVLLHGELQDLDRVPADCLDRGRVVEDARARFTGLGQVSLDVGGRVLDTKATLLRNIDVAVGDDLGLRDGQRARVTVQVDHVDTGDREAGQVGVRVQNHDDLQVGLERPVAGDLTRSPLDLHLGRRHLVLVGCVVADRQHDTVRRPVGDVEAGRGQQLGFIHIASGVNRGLDMVGGVLDDVCPAVLVDGHRRLDVGDVDLHAIVASEVERVEL